MTIKVYLNDGKVEEYPNAYIYWEWDDNEEGTDSGFRINSMDRKFTSVVAFVPPGDVVKIEVTSEESDRVFKSPPKEDCIPVKRWKIFRDVHEERVSGMMKNGVSRIILCSAIPRRYGSRQKML